MGEMRGSCVERAGAKLAALLSKFLQRQLVGLRAVDHRCFISLGMGLFGGRGGVGYLWLNALETISGQNSTVIAGLQAADHNS